MPELRSQILIRHRLNVSQLLFITYGSKKNRAITIGKVGFDSVPYLIFPSINILFFRVSSTIRVCDIPQGIFKVLTGINLVFIIID